jgi:hypothetical protein
MPDLDPQTIDDLRYADQLLELLEGFGHPAEYWECYCLATIHRVSTRAEVWRLTELRTAGKTPVVAPKVLSNLENLRKSIGPLVVELRVVLSHLQNYLPSDELLETAIGFLAFSGRDRDLAAEGLRDPVGKGKELLARMRELRDVAAQYREAAAPPPDASEDGALPEFEGKEIDWPPEEIEAAPAVKPPTEIQLPAGVELPAGVDADVLQDIRRIERLKEQFAAAGLGAQMWEIFCLVTMDRKETRAAMERGAPITELHGRLATWRERYGALLDGLRALIPRMPIGSFGAETMEMALGFIAVSEAGRYHVKKWLEDPDRNLKRAADRIEGVVGKWMKYQTALRMLA